MPLIFTWFDVQVCHLPKFGDVVLACTISHPSLRSFVLQIFLNCVYFLEAKELHVSPQNILVSHEFHQARCEPVRRRKVLLFFFHKSKTFRLSKLLTDIACFFYFLFSKKGEKFLFSGTLLPLPLGSPKKRSCSAIIIDIPFPFHQVTLPSRWIPFGKKT